MMNMATDRKKILFFIDSLACGGAEKSLISLLPLLDYDKIDVDLMMVRRGGVFEQYVPSRARILDFPKPKGLKVKVAYVLFSIMLRLFSRNHGAEILWKATKQIYSVHPKTYDVAIAYQQGFPTYYVSQKVKARKKLAWVNADLYKVGYDKDFNRLFYNDFDNIIPVSDVLCERLRKTKYFDHNKLKVVYDIINVEMIKMMSKENIYCTSDKSFKIVTVGRLVKPKNYYLAVKTAHILKKNGLDFIWYFVGEGNERTNIERTIEEYALQNNVKLVGMTPNPYPYMALADIYVQTSSHEGFGLTLNEARILNKPIVSTNFPVVYNQIRDGVNGLIAEMTPESVAEKIMMIMKNHELRNHIIEETKKEVNTTMMTEPKKVMEMILS